MKGMANFQEFSKSESKFSENEEKMHRYSLRSPKKQDPKSKVNVSLFAF